MFKLSKLLTRRNSFFIILSFTFLMKPIGCTRPVVTNTNREPTRVDVSANDKSELEPALADVVFLDSSLAWATDRTGNTLYYSANGESLQRQVTNFGGKSRISFVDRHHGFAFAHVGLRGTFWRTDDGGKSWVKVVEFDQSIPDFQLTSVLQLHFVDADHGWLVDIFAIWRTQDGGAHWEKVFRVGDHPGLKQLANGAFSGSETALIASTDGIYLTRDGGKTWKLTNKNTQFSAISFLDGRRAWAWSDSLEKSDDAGTSWHVLYKLQSKVKVMSSQFINTNEGWAAGIELPESSGPSVQDSTWHGVLLHTTDGGKTWSQNTGPQDKGFHRVFFADSQNGWLLGHNGLYHTKDGSLTWTALAVPVTSN